MTSVQGVPAKKRTYRVELKITLDEALESQAIQAAREYYGESGGAEEPIGKHGRRMRKISAEEFVSDARDAIMELADANEWFEKAGIEVVGVSCGEPEGDQVGQEQRHIAGKQEGLEGAEEDVRPGELDLDEFETGMYLCRWPNGEFSLVMAETRRDALLELDERAAGHPAQLFPMEWCMLDFGLNDDGQIEFNQFGEDTEALFGKLLTPCLRKSGTGRAYCGLTADTHRKGKN